MISTFLGLLTFSSAYALTSYLHGPYWVPPLAGVIIALASYVPLARALDSSIDIVRGLLRASEPYDYGNSPDEGERGEEEQAEEVTDEDLMLVYYFTNYTSRLIYRRLRRARVEVFSEDMIGIYPEPESEEEQEELDSETFEEPEAPEAELTDGTLVLRLPWRYFTLLVATLRRGDGEAAVAMNEGELRAVYDTVKAIASAEVDDNALASYIAYKAMVRMASEGRLEAPRNLMEMLPFESRELRKKIREQVMEESRS